jgi:iron complex transport system substrate-binding protein
MSSKRSIFYLLGLSASSLILFGACKKKDTQQEEGPPNVEVFQSAIHLTDARGEAVSLDYPAIKIVSLVPSLTEYMFELNKGHLLVGRSEQCRYPADAENVPVAGSLEKPDYDALEKLKPDVVLVSTVVPPDAISRLEESDLTVVVFDHKNWETLCGDLENLGKLLGAPGDVRTLISWMNRQRKNVQSEVESLSNQEPIQTAMLFSFDPLTAAGSDTFVDEFIQLAGGMNVAGNIGSAWPKISLEQLVLGQPEVLLISSDVVKADIQLETLLSGTDWSKIPAIKNHRVYQIESDIITIPGPRLMKGLGEIAAAIHPELFDTPTGLLQVKLRY